MLIFLLLSLTLLAIAFLGFFVRKHIILILICFELILLSCNINFVIFSVYLDDLLGHIYALLVLTIAAVESSLGLALIILYYRLRGGISLELICLLKG
jgi:NADH-quinone oxidoreductase subunit K